MSLIYEMYISHIETLEALKKNFDSKNVKLKNYCLRVRSHILQSRLNTRTKSMFIRRLNNYFINQRAIIKTEYDRLISLETSKYKNAVDAHIAQSQSQSQAQAQSQSQAKPEAVKKALLIGCNYNGTNNELRGCINDVDNIKQRIEAVYGFNNITIMTDDTKIIPTRINIINGITELLNNTTAGDKLFLSFSGHGTYTDDLNGDEKDGKDEMIVPLDFNCITDDELKALIHSNLKENVSLFAIFDCCHSGTILDLKYQYYSGTSKNTIMDNTNDYETNGKVVMISGCMDEQTSADSYINNSYQGAMTWAFLNATKENTYITFKELIDNMREMLNDSTYTQIPMLSSGKSLNLSDTLASVI